MRYTFQSNNGEEVTVEDFDENDARVEAMQALWGGAYCQIGSLVMPYIGQGLYLIKTEE